jgi:microfibrillar-associated protein 1
MEIEKEKEILKEKEVLHKEAKNQTRKMIEEEVIKERLAEKKKEENIECDFLTDDENNNEEDYEAWKLRELKRIKRDRDEREK